MFSTGFILISKPVKRVALPTKDIKEYCQRLVQSRIPTIEVEASPEHQDEKKIYDLERLDYGKLLLR